MAIFCIIFGINGFIFCRTVYDQAESQYSRARTVLRVPCIQLLLARPISRVTCQCSKLDGCHPGPCMHICACADLAVPWQSTQAHGHPLPCLSSRKTLQRVHHSICNYIGHLSNGGSLDLSKTHVSMRRRALTGPKGLMIQIARTHGLACTADQSVDTLTMEIVLSVLIICWTEAWTCARRCCNPSG